MALKVWFQLVDGEGQALTSADRVDCTDDAKVFRFRKAVFAIVSRKLPATVLASDLTVFANRADYQEKKALPKLSSPVKDLGMDEDNPLIVQVPMQRIQAAKVPAIPRTSVLTEPEKYAEECISLTEWSVGAVHKIPSIWRFMSSLGGCTSTGEIFWRKEDEQVASLLLDGWFRASTPESFNPRVNKKTIVVGSPGIGKSTLLCVMAFHLVFKHKKNVLVYRRLTKLDRIDCLLYLGYENDKVVQFAVQRCTSPDAATIYEELIRRQGISNVWLLLDGFLYKDIPEGLHTFNMLATSPEVDLKSGERTDAYCCLLPCWSKKDLWLMGGLIYKFTDEEMEERFYYSGGSVRGFTLPTVDEAFEEAADAIAREDEVSNTDRFCRIFVEDTNDTRHYTSRQYWQYVIDSECAVLGLSVRLNSAALFRIYTWAKRVGYGPFAESVFEIYLHRLAADNALRLYMSEYDPPECRKPNEPRHFEVRPVVLKKGRARCSGTASDHVDHLKSWRDDADFTYWFPACHDFPNIDSIVKIESSSNKKSNVAYLQITDAADHEIDSKQLQEMNKIFYPDDMENAEGTEPPIYLAVCPDRASCEAFILKPPPQVLAARKTCRLYVGYYVEFNFPPLPMVR